MLERYARWLTQRPVAWVVVVATLILGVVTAGLASKVEQDDDMLAFLPRTDPDIRAFYEINEAFGSTEVCLVGLTVPDVLDPAFLGPLQELTRDLRETPGVDHVLTLTNVADFEKDLENGGIRNSTLIEGLPATDDERAALRAKVMSRDHVVGNLINAKGDAVLIYAWVGPGHEPREVAAAVRAATEARFPTVEKVWGGGPFIASFIFDVTEADMARLTPWAVVIILIIVMGAFRDAVGTVLGLVATGIGISTARALMVVSGTEMNLVLSSMPVILFASGSAYAIHMLSKYYQHAERLGPGTEAVVATITGTSRNVIAAGATTIAGLWSFLLMDIAPMRSFGLFTGIGILTALTLSLTFIPAVMALFPRPSRPPVGAGLRDATAYFAQAAREARPISVGGMVVLSVIGALYIGKVDTRVELASFFDSDSPPALSDRFLSQEFGTAQFLQVRVQGDLADPLALGEMARVADELRVVPFISGVQGVHEAMEIIHDAFSGSRRIPDTADQARVLYRFLSSDPAVSRLVTEDRGQALMVARVSSGRADDVDVMLARAEALLQGSALTGYTSAKLDSPEGRAAFAAQVAARVTALGAAHGFEVPADLSGQVAAFLGQPAPAGDAAQVAAAMQAFLGSPENFVAVTPDEAAALATAVAAAAPTDEALAAAVVSALPPGDARAADLGFALGQPLRDAWRVARGRAAAAGLIQATGLKLPDGEHGERLLARLAQKLEEREAPGIAVASSDADASRLTWTVSGQPVLHRGLSRSVTSNQLKSLGGSLLVVFVILTLLLRSVSSGLLATAPTALTVLVVYGTMGALGVHLDIGTSMVGSIIVGAGVDYAVHLLAAWECGSDEPLSAAVRRAIDSTGHAIWTNALMVAMGFYVLTLGDARPLRNVGGLTAVAMIVAALATFVVIPVLANRRRYNAESP